MGDGTRKDDQVPYRSVGPVTETEYESREERYDEQLQKEAGLDPENLSVKEKVKKLREYREDQYQKLCDAVYKRRGWTEDGIPKEEKLKELGLDQIQGVMDLLK